MTELLSVFGLNSNTRNKLREVVRHLRKHGKTIDDFIEYADSMDEVNKKMIAEREKHQLKYEATLPPCPECGNPMFPQPVNTGPGDQTGDDSKIVWVCPNKEWGNRGRT